MKRRAGLEVVLVPPRVEASLWRRLRYESEAACRSQLFDRYSSLARAIALRQLRARARDGIERGDLEHFAYEGLLQAIDRYDPLRGAPFGAFARPRIQGSVASGAAGLTEVHARSSFRRRAETERLRSLHADTGPSDALAALSALVTDLAIGLMLEGTGLFAPDDAADHRPNPYESLAWREMQALLAEAVTRLPEREATIVRQHYFQGIAFTHIAAMLNVTKGRVSQLHRAALASLRAHVAMNS